MQFSCAGAQSLLLSAARFDVTNRPRRRTSPVVPDASLDDCVGRCRSKRLRLGSLSRPYTTDYRLHTVSCDRVVTATCTKK